MTKCIAPLMSMTAQGTIADTITYSDRKSGKIGRVQAKQKDVITNARVSHRSLFKEAVAEWNNFGADLKAEYNTLARREKITGYNKFVSRYLGDYFEEKGLVWLDLGQQFGQSQIMSLAYLESGIALAGTIPSGKILRSVDYGSSWSDLGQQFGQGQILSLAYLGKGICLAGTASSGKILRSVDYGVSWLDLGPQFGQSHITSLAYLGSGIALAGTYPGGKILRSVDYGSSWSDLGQQFGQSYIFSLAYLRSGIALAGTDPGGKILRSVV